MVQDSEAERGSRWAAIVAIAPQIGCAAHTLGECCKRAGIESGRRAGVTTEMVDRMKALERENREPRQAEEIAAVGSAYFAAAERDRRPKT